MRKLYWFLILLFAIAILSLILYVVPITQPSVVGFYSAIWGAVAGVHNAIVTSWVWQGTYQYHALVFAIAGFIGATVLAIKVNGWWHKFRLSQIRTAQKQAGVITTMPIAPAITPAQVAQTPIIPVEPEKQNQ